MGGIIKKKRRCRICNTYLNSYNTDEVCLCHKEHCNSENNIIIEREYPLFGRDTPEINLTRIDYYGNAEGED